MSFVTWTYEAARMFVIKLGKQFFVDAHARTSISLKMTFIENYQVWDSNIIHWAYDCSESFDETGNLFRGLQTGDQDAIAIGSEKGVKSLLFLYLRYIIFTQLAIKPKDKKKSNLTRTWFATRTSWLGLELDWHYD